MYVYVLHMYVSEENKTQSTIAVSIVQTHTHKPTDDIKTYISTVYSGADKRKHQSSTSRAFVRGIHRYRWIPRTKDQ